MEDKIPECEKHTFRIYNDSNLKGMNLLSFYCQHCLKLVIKEKIKGER